MNEMLQVAACLPALLQVNRQAGLQVTSHQKAIIDWQTIYNYHSFFKVTNQSLKLIIIQFSPPLVL
ncbi:MAG: hypothetical protein ISS19_13680 [Bacteroidales bacterium]|nr:hypothetical protein [Bacteroidales bacterium]